MTTLVTLKTHKHSVDVETIDSYERSNHSATVTVLPNCHYDFYITPTRSVKFTELPLVSPSGEPDPAAS